MSLSKQMRANCPAPDDNNCGCGWVEYSIDVAKLERVARAADDFVRSVSAPVEPTNLAKSPAAAYIFAKEIEEALKELPDGLLEELSDEVD